MTYSKPSEYLRAWFNHHPGVTQAALAAVIGTSRYSINQVLNDKRAITPEMAVYLAAATGTKAEAWLLLQMQVDLAAQRALRGCLLRNIALDAHEKWHSAPTN